MACSLHHQAKQPCSRATAGARSTHLIEALLLLLVLAPLSVVLGQPAQQVKQRVGTCREGGC